MCSLLPTSECSENGKKSSNQRFLKGYLRPQRSTFYRVSFLFMKNLGGDFDFRLFYLSCAYKAELYYIHREKGKKI